jgi:hypothetical protein
MKAPNQPRCTFGTSNTEDNKKGDVMALDQQMVNQLLDAVPYPVSKNNLVQMAQQIGANDQIISMLKSLPDKTFNSRQELQSVFEGQGKPGQPFKR